METYSSIPNEMACKQHNQCTTPSKDYTADQSTFNNDLSCITQARHTKCQPTPSTSNTLLHQRNHIRMVASVLIISVVSFLTTLLWEVQTARPLHDSQSVSLLETYAVDYKQLQHIRLQNMKQYSYNYSIYGIDRRENLSLQEYRDVYDGKWPVIITDIIPKWKAANWTPNFFYANYARERVAMRAFDTTTMHLWKKKHGTGGTTQTDKGNATKLIVTKTKTYGHLVKANPEKYKKQ